MLGQRAAHGLGVSQAGQVNDAGGADTLRQWPSLRLLARRYETPTTFLVLKSLGGKKITPFDPMLDISLFPLASSSSPNPERLVCRKLSPSGFWSGLAIGTHQWQGGARRYKSGHLSLPSTEGHSSCQTGCPLHTATLPSLGNRFRLLPLQGLVVPLTAASPGVLPWPTPLQILPLLNSPPSLLHWRVPSVSCWDPN